MTEELALCLSRVNAYLLRLCKPRIRHVYIAPRQGVVFGGQPHSLFPFKGLPDGPWPADRASHFRD